MRSILANNLLFVEGRVVLILFIFIGVIGFLFWLPLAAIAILLLFFSLFFFRNPNRVSHAPTNAILSPADGKIVAISYDAAQAEGFACRISIFLSIWNVHVQRAPISGEVQHIIYNNGKFFPAFIPKSSSKNERNDIIICATNNYIYKIRQIAGIIARRISCWVSVDNNIKRGQPIGMIRFGSRVDFFLPKNTTIVVRCGDHVYGGLTIIGYAR